MSLRTEFGATPATTIDSSTNPVVNCGGTSGVLVQVVSTTSLTFYAQISADGSNYASVPIIEVTVGSPTSAGTSVTPSAGSLYFIRTYGAEKLKLVRSAGSGTVSLRPVFATDTVGAGGSGGSVGTTTTQTAFASAARAVAQAYQSSDLDWSGAYAIRVNLVITSVTATPALTLRVLCKEPIGGVYNYVTAAPTAIAATGHYVYVVGLGAASTGGHIQQTTATMPPATGAIEVTHGDTDSATYSVSVEVLR